MPSLLRMTLSACTSSSLPTSISTMSLNCSSRLSMSRASWWAGGYCWERERRLNATGAESLKVSYMEGREGKTLVLVVVVVVIGGCGG